MAADDSSFGLCLCLCCCTRHANTLRWRACGTRCNIGPHWPCNLFAWALIVGITLAFLALVAVKLHWGLIVADCATCLALIAAFGATSFRDAGYLDRQTPAQLAAQKAALVEDAARGGGGGGAVSAVAPASAVSTTAAARSSGEVVDVEDAAGEIAEGRRVVGVVGAHNPLLAVTACSICNVLRERGTTHCQDCGLCVRELDHHCPWSGSAFTPPNDLSSLFKFLTLISPPPPPRRVHRGGKHCCIPVLPGLLAAAHCAHGRVAVCVACHAQRGSHRVLRF